jgi:hypothetical protein
MVISNIICILQYIFWRKTVCGTRKQEMHAEFFQYFLENGHLED